MRRLLTRVSPCNTPPLRRPPKLLEPITLRRRLTRARGKDENYETPFLSCKCSLVQTEKACFSLPKQAFQKRPYMHLLDFQRARLLPTNKMCNILSKTKRGLEESKDRRIRSSLPCLDEFSPCEIISNNQLLDYFSLNLYS